MSSSRTRGPGAPVRGAVLAGLSALLTATGHVAGGGSLPDLGMLVVLLPLLSAVFGSFAQRCRGVAGTVVVLGAGQLALHHLMTLMHPPHDAGAAMFWMHAAITLVTAVALRHADRAVEAIHEALRRLVPRRAVAPIADRPLPALAVPGPGLPARLARLFAACDIRRGPPVGC